MFHFRDYQEDLPGELRRLASILAIPLDEATAESFAARAELSRMRERAEELAPDTGRSHWLDTSRFFRTGGRGEWQDRFDEALSRRYAERVREFAEGDSSFASWMHEGRRKGDVPLPR